MYHYESVLHNLSLTRKFNFKIICSIEEKLGLETFVRLFILLLVDLSLDLSKVFRVPVVLKDSMTGTQAGETRNWPISPIKSVHEMSNIWTRVSLFSVSTLGYSQSQVSLWQNNAPLHKQNELLTSSRASSAGLNVVPGACACVHTVARVQENICECVSISKCPSFTSNHPSQKLSQLHSGTS